jgi:hypothetical protein
MAKLVISEFLTLDGVMQAPGNPDEDTPWRIPAWRLAAPVFR